MRNYLCKPKQSVRRLLKNEIDTAVLLYSQAGRDYRFASREQLVKIYENGAVWGAFEGHTAEACTAVCRAGADTVICDALMKTRLFKAKENIILPCAGECDKYIGESMFSLDADGAAIPVKSGEAWLEYPFKAGFQLVAMRPLFELRPNYIFRRLCKDDKKVCDKISIDDTLTLSRALENGFAGVSLENRYIVIK